MQYVKKITTREKILLGIIFLLLVLWQSDHKRTEAALPPFESIYSDNSLYSLAKSNLERGQQVKAITYLYAYIQRNPLAYRINKNGHADYVNEAYRNLNSDILGKVQMADYVKSDLYKCRVYPCPGSRGTATAASFPADKVEFCVDINYGGQCSLLGVGEYDRYQELGLPNDSISSIRVGENVKVLLCANNFSDPRGCVEFSGSDSNLHNNMINNTIYPVADNTSTARISYKDGSGYILP